MRRTALKKALIIGGVLLIAFAAAAVYMMRAKVVIADSVQGKIRPYAEQLAAEVNRRISGEFGKTYTLYTTNFEDGDTLPPLFQPEENSILWMGSRPAITPDVRPFDFVFASTRLLNGFLQESGDKSFYLPLFTSHIDIEPREKKFIALIDEPSIAEENFKLLNLNYIKYKLTQEDNIILDMGKIQ